MNLSTVLIANRGEIAVRIIRACRSLGLSPVAVCSEADRGALWTRLADRTVVVGPAPARESYLSIERLIAAAKETGADAVHPGYGLLSESPEFAAAVQASGRVFVGPSPAVIAEMGDKVQARQAAMRAGLPVLPGSDGPVDIDSAQAVAEAVGWPIAVKANFGGGGRGMRIAPDAEALTAALEQASREATAAFGRGEVYLERYVSRPRHIEVQILADTHGSVLHLGDRDCSSQRRHQKLIEEAPAPNLPDALRAEIQSAAVKLARNVGYVGAGTVEFLFDPQAGAFYFLEMNTRLQVEHGVTELVTGFDIVTAQLRVARGEPLGLAQDDVVVRGSAIQARIAAENPWAGFAPTPGRITSLTLPDGPWVRTDFGVAAGDSVPNFYDSMFGKVQAWGPTREDARARLGQALDALEVHGPITTSAYLRGLLDQPDFIAMRHDTGSVERDWAPDPAAEPAAREPGEGAPPSTASRRSIRAPWGGQLVEVTVHGIRREASSPAGMGRGAVRREMLDSRDGPEIRAPMDALIVAVPAQVGQRLSKGEPIVVLEAMKMEIVLSAPADGVLEALHAGAGQTTSSGEVIAIFRRGDT